MRLGLKSAAPGRQLCWLAIAISLTACSAVGPDYESAPISNAEQLAAWPSASNETAPANVFTAGEPASAWWRQLQDPALNQLIELATAANYDLRVAAANVEAARALLTVADTRRRPNVNVSGELAERRNSSATLPLVDSEQRFPTTSFGAIGLGLAWEIDIFGRVRRSIEAASAELGSLEALRHGVMVSVLASVARAYLDYRGAELRLDVAERNVAVQTESLELVELLAREGAATELDVARARTLLLTSRASMPTFRSRMRGALNRLTSLTAQSPGALDAEIEHWPAQTELTRMPALVAAGSPRDLLRRRPDIVAAERRLAAASARIGIATADLFPTVSFGTTLGLNAAPLSGLVDGGAPAFSVGPSLIWNIFDRQGIYARIRQADSQAAADLARYEATVTRALEEVDSALNAYHNERTRMAELEAAVVSSRQAVELAQLRYREGVEDFLDVLDAERSLLVIEDQHAASEINVAQRLIDIHLALGGGWDAANGPEHRSYVPQ